MTKLENKKFPSNGINIGIICICSFFFIYTRLVGNLDEAWNYCFARGSVFGAVPYNDYNTVLPPFFYEMMGLPLHINMSLITYRITEVIINCVIMVLIYYALNYKLNKKLSLAVTLLIQVFMDYNITYNSMLLLFAVVLYMLHEKDKTACDYKHYFIIGIIAAMPVMFRQTTGGLMLLLELAYIFIDKNLPVVKKLLAFLCGVAIPCFGLLFYLLARGNFWGYWDNCFFSLFRVTSQNSSLEVDVSLVVTILIVVAALVVNAMELIRTSDKKYLYRDFLVLSMLSIGVPIFDPGHIFPAVVLGVMSITYVYARKIPNVRDMIVNLAIGLLIAIIVIPGTILAVNAEHLDYSEYKNLPLAFPLEGHENLNAKNREYEASGYKVIMISESKAVFDTLEGKFEAPYHFSGMTNPVGYAQNLPDNAVVVISDTYKTDNWQNPPEVFDYIMEHYVEIDRFGNFGYYIKAE